MKHPHQRRFNSVQVAVLGYNEERKTFLKKILSLHNDTDASHAHLGDQYGGVPA